MAETEADSGILPGEPLPVRLMNTIWADRRGGRHDSIAAATDLAAWLHATGLTGSSARVGDRDLAQARLLRDALRLLAVIRTNGPGTARADQDVSEAGTAAAIATVNAIAAAGHCPPRIGSRDGKLIAEVAPADPHVVISAIAVQAIGLLTDPDTPLRACHGPGCVLFFCRDHPRREWCCAACGNRARAARHYRRHRMGSVG